MCTITFYPADDHYLLSMNRDESRTRSHANPPEIGFSGTTGYMRPIDGDKGGTWIGVNCYGISMCIMNWHVVPQPDGDPDKFISRGWIIPNLMDSIDTDDCDGQLRRLSLSKIKPFRLLVVQPAPLVFREWRWDMHDLHANYFPVERTIRTSSGWNPDYVYRTRKQVFENYWKRAGEITLDKVRVLHATQLPKPGPLAISMSHAKAMSVSNTIVEVSPEKAVMHYLDGFPADSHEWTTVVMERKPAQKLADQVSI